MIIERKKVQIYNNPTIFTRKIYSGKTIEHLQMVNGARIIFTLFVFGMDEGVTVKVKVKDSFSVDLPTSEALSFETGSIGPVKRVLTDFHNLIDVEIEVIGGNAELIFGLGLYDNALQTRMEIENAEISVDLNAELQPNGTYDSVRIGDDQDELAINPDGSINVNIVNTSPNPEIVRTELSEISGVAKDIPSLIGTFTARIGFKTYLQMIEYGGSNIAKFWVKINNDKKRVGRTYFGGALVGAFDFYAYSENGLELNVGDQVKIYVEHYRPSLAEFEASFQVLEIG